MSSEYERQKERDREKLKANLSLMASLTAAASASAAESEAKNARAEMARGLEDLQFSQQQAVEEARKSREEEEYRRLEWEESERSRNEAVLEAPQKLYEAANMRTGVLKNHHRALEFLANDPIGRDAELMVKAVGRYRRILWNIKSRHLTRFEDKQRLNELAAEANSWLSELRKSSANLVRDRTCKLAIQKFATLAEYTITDRSEMIEMQKECIRLKQVADEHREKLDKYNRKSAGVGDYFLNDFLQVPIVLCGIVAFLAMVNGSVDFGFAALKLFFILLVPGYLIDSYREKRRKALERELQKHCDVLLQAEQKFAPYQPILPLFDGVNWSEADGCWTLTKDEYEEIEKRVENGLFFGEE